MTRIRLGFVAALGAVLWLGPGLRATTRAGATAPGEGAAEAAGAPFEALFDGKSLAGWTDMNGKPPSRGWSVVDGALHCNGSRAGHLITERKFDNFELRFEWKIARGGNSGLKYRTTWVAGKGLYGFEYQLLDDDNHPNGKKATTRCGALYDLVAPDESSKALRPPGEYNTSRVIVQGPHIEHWLNDRRILQVDTASDDWKQRIARSKFRSIRQFGAESPGPILLQDHRSEVWFRQILIRPLPASSAASTPPRAGD